MAKLRDAEHLIRLAAVVAIAFSVFLVARAAFHPRSFGEYGFYRGDALKEISAREPRYAGHKACEECHTDVLDVKKTGKHAGVNCEACHGPLREHALDPTSVKPQLPDPLVLCARCHQENIAKPARFPQVNTKDHMGDLKCDTCHQPHNPLEQPKEKKS